MKLNSAAQYSLIRGFPSSKKGQQVIFYARLNSPKSVKETHAIRVQPDVPLFFFALSLQCMKQALSNRWPFMEVLCHF